MLKNKKKLYVIFAIVAMLVICLTIALIFLKNNRDTNEEENSETPKEEVVIPTAPSENTESLIQNLEKVEVVSLSNDIIEFSKDIEVETGEKVAVWVYSTPKFLGYFEIIMENDVKIIKGLDEALKKLDVESGAHNLAIVTEEGKSIGYIDVYIDENKFFEDEKSAEIAKYTTKEVTETIEVQYKTETKKSANKKNGTKEVTQKGVNGIKEITYKITYDESGNEISKEQIDEKTIQKTVNEIIVVGAADYNINSSKITNEIIGFMCSENQTITYDGQKGCDDSQELPSFKIIAIDGGSLKVVTLNEVAITPITVTKNGNLYVGTYKGTTHYFDPRGGGGNPDGEPLTLELCKQYNLSCGTW